MEISKKQWTIIAVVIAVIAIWYFFLRKKPAPAVVVVPTPKAESSWIPGRGDKTFPIPPCDKFDSCFSKYQGIMLHNTGDSRMELYNKDQAVKLLRACMCGPRS